MIATVIRDFVYTKKNNRYRIGDVISLSTDEFERINKDKRPILLKGKHDLGKGICEPCEKLKTIKSKK